MRFRQADQRIATVGRPAQHDIVVLAQRIDGGAQDRQRQGRAVGIDQDGAAMSRFQQHPNALKESNAEIAVDLRHQSEACRQQRS